MNIFISYTKEDTDFAIDLFEFLSSNGQNVFFDQKSIIFGEKWDTVIADALDQSDIMIVIVSPTSNESRGQRSEILYALQRKKSIIPIIIGDRRDIFYETGLSRFQGIFINDKSEKARVFDILRSFLYAKDASIKETLEEKKAAEEKVHESLSEYLKETLISLKANAKKNSVIAYILYGLSIIPIAIAIVLAICFSRWNTSGIDNIILLVINSISTLTIIVLLISVSKLLFTLGKSFMVESIRNSDRVHAISFGKFFLDAFGDSATHEEVLKAFSSWNIDDGKTIFREQSGDDYDPKIDSYLDGLKEIIVSSKK